MGDVSGKVREASKYILKSANHVVEGHRQLYQLGRHGLRFKTNMQLIRSDASHLPTDTSNRSVPLINGEPGCQQGYQARKKGDNPEVASKTVQIMQMKVDARGYREPEPGGVFKPA